MRMGSRLRQKNDESDQDQRRYTAEYMSPVSLQHSWVPGFKSINNTLFIRSLSFLLCAKIPQSHPNCCFTEETGALIKSLLLFFIQIGTRLSTERAFKHAVNPFYKCCNMSCNSLFITTCLFDSISYTLCLI